MGTFGDAAVFLLMSQKYYDWGRRLNSTSNPEIAKKCRLIRNRGEAM